MTCHMFDTKPLAATILTSCCEHHQYCRPALSIMPLRVLSTVGRGNHHGPHFIVIYEINIQKHNRNLWKKAYGIKISTVFLHAVLPKLGTLVYRGILQCGWMDSTSPPQPPAGPPNQWCVNSDQGAMPGVWACINNWTIKNGLHWNWHQGLMKINQGIWSATRRPFLRLAILFYFRFQWPHLPPQWLPVHG